MNSITNELTDEMASKDYRDSFANHSARSYVAHQFYLTRLDRGLTIEQLALIAEVDAETVNAVEDADSENVTFESFFRVAAGLDVCLLPRLVGIAELLNSTSLFSSKAMTVCANSANNYSSKRSSEYLSTKVINISSHRLKNTCEGVNLWPERKISG